MRKKLKVDLDIRLRIIETVFKRLVIPSKGREKREYYVLGQVVSITFLQSNFKNIPLYAGYFNRENRWLPLTKRLKNARVTSSQE